jgi:hypothetical protein
MESVLPANWWGYSLGFPASALQKISNKHACIFTKCIYDDKVKKVIDHFIKEYLKDLENKEYERVYKNINIDDFTDLIVFNFQSHLSRISLLLKNDGFEEGKEYRLIYTKSQPGQVEFRKGRNGLIPYHVLEFDKTEGSVSDRFQLVVGPSPLDESEVLKSHHF